MAQKPLPAGATAAAEVDEADVDVSFGVVVDTATDPESSTAGEVVAGAVLDGLVVVLDVRREPGCPLPPLNVAHRTRMNPTSGSPTKTSRRRQ